MKQEPITNLMSNLPPDGYSRFFVIKRLLQEVYKGSDKRLKILDVGGCSPYLHKCLSDAGINFELTIIDILPKPRGLKGSYIQADITTSDIAVNSYDVVVSTDVLEHIPQNRKDKFIKACYQIGSELIIIAAPFDTEGVDEAEHAVNEFNKKLFGVGQQWLEEHFEFTKPSIPKVKKYLDNLKASYLHFGANNLYSWIFSAHINLLDAKIGLKKSKLKSARGSYNNRMIESIEFTEPTYRHFFVVFKEERLKNRLNIESIIPPANPRTFMDYLHDLMETIYIKTAELKKANEEAVQAVSSEKKRADELQLEIDHLIRKRIARGVRRISHMQPKQNIPKG